MKKSLPKLTLIVGGAASGKSFMAEQMVERHSVTKTYIATAQIFDDEMAQKVSVHKNRRGAGWDTVEEPMNAAAALRRVSTDAVLFDCATLWLSNQILANSVDLDAARAELLSALADCPVPVVVVSNEVGQGIVPENALARRFREAQGRLNIDLAGQADLVIQVTVGLPTVLKGDMP